MLLMRLPTFSSYLLFAMLIPLGAWAQVDDFDDGNADGWTELVPLSAVGGTGLFSFPGGNTYRMQASASPDEDAFGQARIGALRTEVEYGEFYQFVDVVGYDQALDQNIGMLARVTNPGAGTLNGYGVTYNPTDQAIFLTVITGELGPNIGDAEVPLAPGVPVRLVFQGKGDSLKFEVFALSDLSTAVASIEVDDSTWTTGVSGLFAVTDGADPALPTDCTFDNYFAAEREPFEFRIVNIEIDGAELVFDFLSKPGQQYSLWFSDDLTGWAEDADSIPASLGTQQTRYRITMPAVGRRFYEFRLD